MKFAVMIALLGATEAIRINRRGPPPAGNSGRGPPPQDGGSEGGSGSGGDGEYEQDREQDQGPSPSQIFNECNANNDTVLTLNEATACASRHITEMISEHWPMDNSTNPATPRDVTLE
jgi:hypothetical protein